MNCFFDWALSRASTDSSATTHTVLGKKKDRGKLLSLKRTAECFPIPQRTLTSVNRYMKIFVMWKVTDKGLILSFGSTVNQPAGPYGEHGGGKRRSLVAKSRTPPINWCGSCFPAVPQKQSGDGKPLADEARQLKWKRQRPLTSSNSMDNRWTKASDLET